jgi:hypothetical protein
LNFDIPDEDVLVIEDDDKVNDWWTMYFDKVANILGNVIEVVIISSEKKQCLVLVRL